MRGRAQTSPRGRIRLACRPIQYSASPHSRRSIASAAVSLREQLDAAYQRANTHLPDNPDLRFENDELVLSHLDRLEEPSSLITLRRDIQTRLPKGDLPDILLEVCTRTDLADSFTHVSERGARVADFPISLAAVLIAQSCNIGFEPMIRTDIPALRRERLSWVGQNFVREETLRVR